MSEKHLRFIEMAENLERIITIFKHHPDGLTTGELYEQMRVLYGYEQTKENMDRTYLRLLEHGAIKGVKFTRVFRGKHKLVDTRFESAALDREKKAYIKLALETVEELDDISRHHREVCSKLHLDELQIPFYIKPEAYQRLNTDEEEISNLEEAILGDNIIEFRYKGQWYHVAPYRLVNFDGIWYLYGKDMEERGEHDHKTWMLEFIDDVTVYHSQKHDTPDEEIEQDLDKAYGAQFIPDHEIEMQFFIDDTVADLFRLKAHFPRQQIVEEKAHGILFKSVVSSFAEVEQEIKSWIPHIHIISPDDFREKIHAQLKSYMKKEESHR
jgi:predicted DNA-binding transcriptional regulator YafY